MGDSIGMDVMERSYQLLSNLPYFRLLEILVIFDDVKQLALAQLRHDYELGIRLERVKQNYNIGMLQLFQDGYLFSHCFDILLLLALLLDCFYGYELACEFLPRLVHLSVCSFADERDDVVVLSFTLCRHFKF